MGQSEGPPRAQPAPEHSAAQGSVQTPGRRQQGCRSTGPGGLRAEQHTAKNCGTPASPPLLRVRRRPLTRAGQALPAAGARVSAHATGNQAPRAASLGIAAAGPHASSWEKGTFSPARPTLPAVS